MTIPAFSESELKVVDTIPADPFTPEFKIFDYPTTPGEAARRLFDRKPIWQVIALEMKIFSPRICPDFIARAWVNESKPFDPDTEGGGLDMFGIEWEYVPVVMGSMVKPGTPTLHDANDWKDVIKFPDVDSWDWAGSAAENNGTYLTADNYNQVWIQNGWFERLISFMDFEEAIIALVDPDQKDAVKELFDAISDLYIDIIDHFLEHFDHIDGFYIHDDWGSQQNSFFSPAVAEEMIVPAMKKVVDHIHSKGLVADLHSCGNIANQVPNMIKAGWDAWTPQPMNDMRTIHELYGDKIIIASIPDPLLSADATEEEQRAAAREYAERYCDPAKPTYFPVNGYSMLTPAFREELYVASRKLYAGQAL